jgi:hypothetical protein
MDECFLHGSGRPLGIPGQFVAQRKSDPQALIRCRTHLHVDRQPKTPLRPARVIAQEIAPDPVARYLSVSEIVDPIDKKFEFGADLWIETGKDEGSDIITQLERVEAKRLDAAKKSSGS